MSSTNMEVDPEPQRGPVKRRLMDADNNQLELPDPKKARVQLDSTMKSNVMDAIVATYIRIAEKLVSDSLPFCRIIRNVHLGDQIMNSICSAHNLMRQDANGFNGSMSLHRDKTSTFNCEANSISLTLAEVAKILEETLLMFQLKYIRPTDGEKNHWFGVIAPLLSYLCAHKLRRDELRVGHDKMPISKKNSIGSYVTTESYGMQSAHHILLEGISFPPEKRSVMTQSLGPMTTAIMVAKNGNNLQFGQKWKDALARDCSHVPEIQSIINMASGKNASDVRGLFQALANVILITTSRNVHRAFFSICMVTDYLMTSDEIEYYRATKEGKYSAKPYAKKPEDTTRKTEFNFSDVGMFKCWNAMNGDLYMPNTMRQDDAAQVFFHATFGTYKEDLSILRQVTTMPRWKTRRELGEFMKDFGTKKEVIAFSPPKFLYYSKLSSANQTGLLSNARTQVHTAPVFSGMREQKPTDAFFKHFKEVTADSTIVGGKNIHSLTTMLKNICERLIHKIQTEGTIKMVTVKWLPVSYLEKSQAERDAAAGTVFQGESTFFLSGILDE